MIDVSVRLAKRMAELGKEKIKDVSVKAETYPKKASKELLSKYQDIRIKVIEKVYPEAYKEIMKVKKKTEDITKWPWWIPRPPYTTQAQIDEILKNLKERGIGWPIKQLKIEMPKFELKIPQLKWPKIPWLPIGIIMGLGIALIIALEVKD